MITHDELSTYTKDDLILLVGMCKELLKKKDGPIKSFYIQLEKNKEYTRTKLYEEYKIYADDNKIAATNKELFNRISNCYIDDFKIKMYKRVKEKVEKVKKGDEVSSKEE